MPYVTFTLVIGKIFFSFYSDVAYDLEFFCFFLNNEKMQRLQFLVSSNVQDQAHNNT